MVWLFYGDKPAEERPPLPVAPELTEKGYHVVWDTCDVAANHSNVMDTLLDVERLGLESEEGSCGEDVQVGGFLCLGV